ncbi:glycoside hydrolase domain-containing protein [Bacillus toyonensis]|uniref:glycoside hydrolase domain-containing protein n=1 Tax=Bacillus toyonensis TaxID=155322 RepID=UPI000BEFD5CF|nr:glycoside hydrolase domain-containing protein [Bacillus toyonensis]PEM83992.1 hypothetical protein CN629_28115 [Bacillus toyonensis]
MGKSDAAEAVYAARKYGFKPGTIIYFAVDFDAFGEDIVGDGVKTGVIPYFEGVVQNLKQMSNGEYKVGVYGPRGVCIKVSDKFSEVVSSFVSGMSSGYSANLGYPLPKNWAFDQIKEYTIGSGAGLIAIDKNIKSGRDQGQSSVNAKPSDSNAIFKEKLETLHNLAMKESSTIEEANDKCLDYLRYENYNGLAWDVVAGPLDKPFIERAKKVLGNIGDFPSLIDPKTGIEVDLQHMAATCDSAITLHDAALSNYAGWAGDLMTAVRDSINMSKNDPKLKNDIYTAAFRAIGSAGTSFSYPDLIADVDAYNIARKILDSNHKISVKDAILDYLNNGTKKRFTTFFNTKFGGSADKAYKDATLYLNATEELLIPVKKKFLDKFGMSDFSKEIGEDVSRAWKDKLLEFVKDEEILLV